MTGGARKCGERGKGKWAEGGHCHPEEAPQGRTRDPYIPGYGMASGRRSSRLKPRLGSRR